MPDNYTLPSMLQASCRQFAGKPAHFTKVGGKFQPVTYTDLRLRVVEIAFGLKSLGVENGATVAIFAESSSKWSIADWAITSIGAVSVPIFPTLTPETVRYILRDSGCKAVFVGDAKLLKKLEEAVFDSELQVLPIIMEGEATYTWQKLIDDGMQAGTSLDDWIAFTKSVQPTDVAAIIYTSGTTGEPKGAVLTHEAFAYQCAMVRKNLPVDDTDRFLSFLPMSHVYERMGGHYFPISAGCEVAFADSLKSLSADIIATKPTVMTVVPRFLENVRTKVLAAMEEAPALRKRLFQIALAQGAKRISNNGKPVGIIGRLLDKLVGSKIRDKFGGRLRFMVSGGAALPQDVAVFYAAFGIKLLQGYGLTETAPVISLNHPDRNKPDSVGEILEGLDVKIASDGEIIMNGPTRLLRYHNKPEETAEAIDSDGYFHTGDIGTLKGNRLWITDRKKDILVMSNGKNVAPAAIEGRLKASPYIEEAMVIGDGMDHIAALIVPCFETLNHFAHQHGIITSHHHEVASHPEVTALIKKEIEAANKGLADFEKVKGHKILSAPWTIDTGELTPSLKVKRPVIREKYTNEIDELRKR
ncbi:MAG: long-chain fatty acid--CoA ligase [Armatimonadota bacterium]|nr:long-chain fatty acid--CoA ligase [Armatimonadota bacterium]